MATSPEGGPEPVRTEPGHDEQGHGEPETRATQYSGLTSAPRPLDPEQERSPVARWLERLEIVLSGVAFLAMFIVIALGVLFRYVLHDPLTWSVSVATSLFIWTTMITAGLPHWADEHIQFDVLYVRFGPKAQRWARIAGNVIIIVPAAIVIPASFRYLLFIQPERISGLNLSLTWGFAGIAYFFITTVIHRFRLLLQDLLELVAEHRTRVGEPA